MLVGLVTSTSCAATSPGGEVLHPPKHWPEYHPACYATFFLDPDGFRIEAASARDARQIRPQRAPS